jgi:hypothetical protein
MYNIARIIISILPMVLGGSLILDTTFDIHKNIKASGWPVTKGVISENPNKGRFLGGHQKTYIAYTFIVDEKQYTGYRVSFGYGLASDYSKGQSVNVYYSPMDKGISLLEPGFKAYYAISILFGLSFVLIGNALRIKLR